MTKPRVLLVDNDDSFTYNLVQLLEESRLCSVNVRKHHEITIADAEHFDKILFSPGPGVPSDFPVMTQLLHAYSMSKSFLGICLGHQAIAEHFGAVLYRKEQVRHGQQKQLIILDTGELLFRGIPETITVGLYHSWAVDKSTLPECLHVTSVTEDGVIMSLRHNRLDIRGVQFHPESYISNSGQQIICNWLQS